MILVIAGIVALYQGLQYVLGVLLPFGIGLFSTERRNLLSLDLFSWLFFGGIYFLAGFVLIRWSGVWSEKILNQGKVGELLIPSSPNAILYYIFIFLGISALVRESPVLLLKIFNGFSDSIDHRIRDSYPHTQPGNPSWAKVILDNLIPLLLVICAKDLADFFSKKIPGRPGLEFPGIRSNPDAPGPPEDQTL
jgi:hypothetical protein